MILHPVDTILSLVLLSVLFAFGSSRLPGLIKVIAFQGIVVSMVPEIFILNVISLVISSSSVAGLYLNG